MNKEFDSEPAYGDNDKYIKAKINLYENKVNTNFQGKKKYPKRCIIWVFVIENAKFSY